MAKTSKLSDEEVIELFSQLDETGVVNPQVDGAAKAGSLPQVDPLSMADPSGSRTGEAISRTALVVIIAAILLIVGLQVGYGVSRRLNTANLSASATTDSVRHALESGVEWGNGFTQFPETFEVNEANEKTGAVEVSVTDTRSHNELELLSNSQIQAAALATNALLNDKINRVTYRVFAYVHEDGSYQTDQFFGFLKAKGQRRPILTFIWTKERAAFTGDINWQLKIIGMDDKTALRIQKQVNAVSSLIEYKGISQRKLDKEFDEVRREHLLHGSEIFWGGAPEKKPDKKWAERR
ncbi:hypothetical protein K6V98_05340 [Collinsella sp. AGMB00827]|uniref:DUF4825 domain-containing protein n=1 Tax=Collinsella ureilytica TaxID=2869515 RepID=A0ABS7MMY0_9ACTN|nr:hypothetical protein [Collinsella urealyticum]MBY4797780.1 hypothetical protein [Collinsella urealyticum]